MMTLERATQFIHELAIKENYSVYANLPVRRNNRLKTCFGRCHLVGSFATEIELSGLLLDTASENDIIEVCIHELAHAIAARKYKDRRIAPHGPEFQMVCETLGGHHLGATNAVKLMPTPEVGYKYVLECPECGAQWHYKTKCKKIQHPEFYSCGCGCNKLIARKL